MFASLTPSKPHGAVVARGRHSNASSGLVENGLVARNPRLSKRVLVLKAVDDFATTPPQLELDKAAAGQAVNQQQRADLQSRQPPADASGCPFSHNQSPTAGAAAVPQPKDGSQQLYMEGPGWRVVPPGSAHELPPVPHRAAAATDNNPMGEFGEFDQRGAGAFLLDRYQEFGPLFSWQMGPTTMVTLLDYEAIKTLLQADNKVIVGWNPEPFYIMLGEEVREGMENPVKRLANRKAIQSGFSREAMAGYVDKLEGICRKQLEEWCSVDGPVDLAAKGKDLSFDFSTHLLVELDVSSEQKVSLRAKFDALFLGLFSPPDPTPGSRFANGMQARQELLHDLAELVQAREEKRRFHVSSSSNSTTAKAHKSVFDYSLDDMRALAGGEVNAQRAAQTAMGLIIAGNDTSGLGLSALLATLPLFPNVMDKLRREQQQVVDTMGAAVTPAALEAMPYADAVIREVLRVTPPSASVFRRTLVDLEICNKFVPANTPLLLSTFMAQVLTDPHLKLGNLSKEEFKALEDSWACVNAALLRQEFNPDRWLTRQEKPSSLLTFSAGPHVCLGMGLFFAEAKMLLALLARDYVIKCDNPVMEHVNQSPGAQQQQVGFKIDFNTHLKQGSVRFTRRHEGAHLG